MRSKLFGTLFHNFTGKHQFLISSVRHCQINSRQRCVRLANQDQLPKPPVPTLEETFRKYEDYVSVIAPNDVQLRNTQKLISDFLKFEGQTLQKRLREVADKVPNWCSHYWLNDMYLDVRLPLPINVNPAYVFPQQLFHSQEQMVDYSLLLICGLYEFKSLVDRRQVVLDRSTGKTSGDPLCMEQYWRIFTSYRSPGSPRDFQYTNLGSKSANDIEHIIVMCNSHCFQMAIAKNGERLSLDELKSQLEEIVFLAKLKAPPECPVNLLTTTDRDRGAKILNCLRQEPSNEQSLQLIQQSVFVLCLDKAVQASNGAKRIEEISLQLLHGCGTKWNASNRWYDKTNQFIVSEDGVCGMNFEHSVAEGIVLVKMVEHALDYITKRFGQKLPTESYKPHIGFRPKQLTWNVSEEATTLLRQAKDGFDRLIDDIELKVVTYHSYGKNFPKAKNISPDCYIQLILQLAHYRLHGHLVSTYESASVDNIRSAHSEAFAWVRLMEDEASNKAIRLNAFANAVRRQQEIMYQNIAGYGIDNHLVALREIAKEVDIPTPELFEDEMFREAFRFPLSTSQVPTRYEDSFFCYGPVVPDGYGCSYNPFDSRLVFGVSAFNSCAKTNATAYAAVILKTLDDMRIFLDNWHYH